MLTQVKLTKLKIPEDAIITLEVNPQITTRLRMNRRMSTRNNISPKTTKKPSSPESHQKGDNIMKHSFNSIPVRSNLFSQQKQKKTQKPKHLSSYQLYKQQQKQSKLYQRERSMDWRFDMMSKQSHRRNMEHLKFSRTVSTGEHKRNTTIVQALAVTEIIAKHRLKMSTVQESKPRSRSLYIRSNQGKRKTVDNQKYLEQLKQTLENQHFTNVKQAKAQFKQLSPKIFSISTKNKEEKQKGLRSSPKAKFQLNKNRSSTKKSPLDHFNESIICRPWSGNKVQNGMNNDISLFFPAN